MAGMALMEGLALLSCFGGWLEEFWDEGGWFWLRAPRLPSHGLFRLCESPRTSRCGDRAQTLMGLGARDATEVGTPLSCAPAATTDNLPPCRVLFGGAGVSRVLCAVGLTRAGTTVVFPGVLPCSTLGTPTLSRVSGAIREGVSARCVTPPLWLGELSRAGNLDGGGCIPEGATSGSRILQEESTERGQGAAMSPLHPSPLHPAWCWAALEGRGKKNRDGRKTVLNPGGLGHKASLHRLPA